MPKIHITGRNLPKAKNGLSVQSGPCPPGPNGEIMIRVDGVCVEFSKLQGGVYPTEVPGEYSRTYSEAGAKRAKMVGDPDWVGPNVYSGMAPRDYQGNLKKGKFNEEYYSTNERLEKYYDKLVDCDIKCPKGYIIVDCECVKTDDIDYNVNSVPGKKGQYTTEVVPQPKGFLPEIVVFPKKRKEQWYDGIASMFGYDSPKELRKLDKVIEKDFEPLQKFFERGEETFNSIVGRNKLTRRQKDEIDDIWQQELQNPTTKERVKNDPIAYQMLRLETFRKAGVSNGFLQKNACSAGLGFHWDEEKQTCVEDDFEKHPVSGEASTRTINPQVYQSLFGDDLTSLGLTEHDIRIKKRIPYDRRQEYIDLQGGGRIPFYEFNPISKNGGYSENGLFNRIIDPKVLTQEGKPTVKVSDLFANAYYEKDLNDLNSGITAYHADDYKAKQEFEKAVDYVQDNGLEDMIAPHQDREATKETMKFMAKYAPGYVGGNIYSEAARLPSMYGKDVSAFNKLINLERLKVNLASEEGPSTGSKVGDFFKDMAVGTLADVTGWADLGRGAASKMGIGTAPKNLQGYSIYSPTVVGQDQAMHNVPGIGIAGGSNIPNLWNSMKSTGQNLSDVFQGKKSPINALRVFPDLAGLGFQTLLTIPVGGTSRSVAKPLLRDFENVGYKYFTKPGLKTTFQEAGRSILNPIRETIGNYAGKPFYKQAYTAIGTPVRAINNLYFHPLTVATSFPAKIFPFKGTGAQGWAFKAGEDIYGRTVGKGNDPFALANKYSGLDAAFNKIYNEDQPDNKLSIPTSTELDVNGKPSFGYYDEYQKQLEQKNIEEGKEFLNDPDQRKLYKFFPKQYKNFQEGIYNIGFGGKKYKFDTKLFDKDNNLYLNKSFLNMMTDDKKLLTPSIYDYEKKIFNFDLNPNLKQTMSDFLSSPSVSPYLKTLENNRRGGSVKRRRK